jgi:hypothetical protein
MDMRLKHARRNVNRANADESSGETGIGEGEITLDKTGEASILGA